MTRDGGVATSRRGAVLVLTIFFIVLASSLTVLIMAGTVQLLRTTRHEHESILLRQLTDSGRAWANVRGGLHADTPVTLSGKDVLPEDTAGEVRISVDKEFPDVMVVTAHVRFSGREVTRTTRFVQAP